MSYVFPPYLYLTQVATHCAKAVGTYMKLWEQNDSFESHILIVDKSTVRDRFAVSLSKFRHDVFLLTNEGLVSVKEDEEYMKIELTKWDIDASGHTLC